MNQVYKATDGSEHAKAKDAKRRDALVSATEAFKVAQRKLCALLIAGAMTADGAPFDFTRRSYWRIREWWGQAPSLVEVMLWPYATTVDFDYRIETFVVRENDNSEKCVQYRVGELYADERAARKAMAELYRQRLAEMQADIGRLTGA